MIYEINDMLMRYVRYTIADDRLKELIFEIWEIYHEIQTILFMKVSIRELEDRDKKWLRYLFGDLNAEKIVQEWTMKSTSFLNYRSEDDKHTEMLGMKENDLWFPAEGEEEDQVDQ